MHSGPWCTSGLLCVQRADWTSDHSPCQCQKKYGPAGVKSDSFFSKSLSWSPPRVLSQDPLAKRFLTSRTRDYGSPSCWSKHVPLDLLPLTHLCSPRDGWLVCHRDAEFNSGAASSATTANQQTTTRRRFGMCQGRVVSSLVKRFFLEPKS